MSSALHRLRSTPSLPPPTWSDLVTVRHFSRLDSGGGRAATETAHAPAAVRRPSRMRPLLCRARNENETRTNNLVYARRARPFCRAHRPYYIFVQVSTGCKRVRRTRLENRRKRIVTCLSFHVYRRCACTMLPPLAPLHLTLQNDLSRHR